jgi:hypothetical protein
MSNIVTESIDAESGALVCAYHDGRVIALHEDGLREVYYPDTTRIVTHASGAVVYVTKDDTPSVEVDVEVNDVSRDHAKGIKVPIAKGGDRVRVRVSLPDGTAAMVSKQAIITHQSQLVHKIQSLSYVVDRVAFR